VIKDRVYQKGDIFRVDMGYPLNGYHADVCKSGCVGAETADEHRKRYDAVQAGVLKSAESLKKPARVRRSCLKRWSLECALRGCRTAELFRWAHHGLEAREFPFLFGPAEEIDDPFLPNTSNVSMKPRMAVNLEASGQVMGWGSVQVKYTCAVTENGREHLVTPDTQKLFTLLLQ
jgi:Xaa-Pro aminopeptidase